MPTTYPFFCPVCDRPYSSTVSREAVLETVKKHVAGQHPDYDPEWWDTYPTNAEN